MTKKEALELVQEAQKLINLVRIHPRIGKLLDKEQGAEGNLIIAVAKLEHVRNAIRTDNLNK